MWREFSYQLDMLTQSVVLEYPKEEAPLKKKEKK